MERVDTDPDAYLASLPAEVRPTMETLDRVVTGALPDRGRHLWTGTFWGGTAQVIVGYGSMTQRRARGADVDWFVVGLARQKHHFSLYVNAVEDDRYLANAYAERLGKVKLGSASIGFTRIEDVDLDVLGELLERANALTRP